MLVTGLQDAADKTDIPFTTNYIGGMFGVFFTTGEKQITTFAQVMSCDQGRFRKFFHGMLRHGIYLAPSAYETGFVSSKHTRTDIITTIRVASTVMKELQ